jgi:uncharacterized protein YneF (UPF0154 family)
MKKRQIFLLSVLLIFGVVAGGWITGYFMADAAYERLIRANPSTRSEVVKALPYFKEVRIEDLRQMQPLLRDQMLEREDLMYYRYVSFLGFPIDVVYDAEGSVDAIWPEYE